LALLRSRRFSAQSNEIMLRVAITYILKGKDSYFLRKEKTEKQ